MTLGLLIGAALGCALCLLLFAIAPPRPHLTSQLRRWERDRASHVQGHSAGNPGGDRAEQVGGWLVAQASRRGIGFAQTRTDLAVVDQSVEGHLVRKVGYGLVGLVAPSVLSGLLFSAGITAPVAVPAIGGLMLGVLGFVLPDLQLRERAAERRDELRQALATYLDLVSMSMAGGQAAPQALPAAARHCRGWAFELITDTISHARDRGDTPWQAFMDLGRRTGVPELVDLGGALTLVANDGAKVRTSLAARAATQRQRQVAESYGAAERADEAIRVAQVLLAIAFLLFLGYPAVISIMAI